MTGIGPRFEHERYEELCALATAGVLSNAESALVAAHLESCAECRDALAQYRSIATDGMSFLAGEFAACTDSDKFDKSTALKRLMRASEMEDSPSAHLAVVAVKSRVWNRGWVRGVAAASLVAALGIGAYRVGTRSADARLRRVSAESQFVLDRARGEEQRLESAIRADSERIAVLQQETIAEKTNVEKLRSNAEADTQRMAQVTGAMEAAKSKSDSQLEAFQQERDANADKLLDVENRYQTVKSELAALRTQHQQDVASLASLKTSIDSLTAELDEENRRAGADEKYLAADKDIRDLIGARNLYIADIMDVNETGESQRAFGRVFYTKTKSLIFYAYDLDQQPGVKRTSIFQVWGRTGANDHNPINLGILYMDSATNRRWTLRVNNSEQLARLDSIFVTIEPHEQADRPTGKPFLYASLQRLPNHP